MEYLWRKSVRKADFFARKIQESPPKEKVSKEEICEYAWSCQKDCVNLHATSQNIYENEKAIIYNINRILVFLFK
jgi:hypothetical protein